ncbi:MAG TPA: LamG-like jellyroll fold domain-containing protein [Pyrinomonadaceae bacterium]
MYAINSAGSSAGVEQVYTPSVPSPPTGGVATPNATYTELRLDWTAPAASPAPIKHYLLYEYTGGVDSFRAIVGGTRAYDVPPTTGTRTYHIYSYSFAGKTSTTPLTITYTQALPPALSSLTLSQVKGWTPSGAFSIVIRAAMTFGAFAQSQRVAVFITRPGLTETFFGFAYPDASGAAVIETPAMAVGTFTIRTKVEDYNGNSTASGQLSSSTAVTQLQSSAWNNSFPQNFTYETLAGPRYRWKWDACSDAGDAARTVGYKLYAQKFSTGAVTLIYEGPNTTFERSTKFLAGLMSDYDWIVYPVDAVGNVGTWGATLSYHSLYATDTSRVDVGGNSITITKDATIQSESFINIHNTTTLERLKVAKTVTQVKTAGSSTWPTSDGQTIDFRAPEDTVAYWPAGGSVEIRVGMYDEFGNVLWSNTLTHTFATTSGAHLQSNPVLSFGTIFGVTGSVTSTLAGARIGDGVSVSPMTELGGGITPSAYCKKADEITVRLINSNGAAAVIPDSGYAIDVFARPRTLLSKLVSFWKLGEATGAQRSDSVSTNHLTSVNGVTQVAGRVGNAAGFASASSQYLSCADNAALSTGDIDFFLSCWVQLTTKAASMVILGKWTSVGGGSTENEYILQYTVGSDRFEFYVSAAGTAAVGVTANVFGSPTTGLWNHIIVWHDSVNNVIGIRVNNGTANTTAHSGGVKDSTAPFIIGATAVPGAYLNGLVDAVGFWKKVPTDLEVTQLYNVGVGIEHPF